MCLVNFYFENLSCRTLCKSLFKMLPWTRWYQWTINIGICDNGIMATENKPIFFWDAYRNMYRHPGFDLI